MQGADYRHILRLLFQFFKVLVGVKVEVLSCPISQHHRLREDQDGGKPCVERFWMTKRPGGNTS